MDDLKLLKVSVGVYSFFFLIELIGAFYVKSITMGADSAIMFVDIVSYVLNHEAENGRIAKTTPVRFSLSALAVTGVVVSAQSIASFSEPETEFSQELLVPIASCNLLADMIIAYGFRRNDNAENTNVQTAVLHVTSDLLRSGVVLTVALVEDIEYMDSIGGLLISLWVFAACFRLLRKVRNTGEPTEYDGILDERPAVKLELKNIGD